MRTLHRFSRCGQILPILFDALAKRELRIGRRDRETLASEAALIPQRVIFCFWPFGMSGGLPRIVRLSDFAGVDDAVLYRLGIGEVDYASQFVPVRWDHLETLAA